MRLLQAKNHSGFEADPTVFFEWVRAVGRYNPSAGWVAGVVGVHPWELALVDERLQEEIYAENPDTWVASPYAPQGRAVREGDGFRFSGRWQYSTGTDHCDWVVLGGIVVDETGSPSGPPEVRHFFLPRGDYQIVEDSWQVMGLSGTGSKDILVEDAFVPEYRTMLHGALSEGEYAERRARTPLYSLPFGCIFSAAIASGTFGIAEGAIEQFREYLKTRVSVMGVAGKQDPYQQAALAEAEADLAAGITHMDVMMNQWMEQLKKGEPISRAQRFEFRRNQVRAVQRVLFAVDNLFARGGSAAIWTTRPLERYWRDLRTGGTHICDMADVIYGAWANHEFETGINTTVMH
jgi:alkylation response protein AidB-like acyl-CoA dehydrogenase